MLPQRRRADVNWHWDSNPPNNNYQYDGDNEIHLRATAPDFRSIVVHELGHAVMDDVYEDRFPNPGCADPHFIEGNSGVNCAWVEGSRTGTRPPCPTTHTMSEKPSS